MTVSLIAAFLLLAMSAQAEDAGAKIGDRFALWNECRPMGLTIEKVNQKASEIGLTEEVITTTARSRLRSARLYVDYIDKWVNDDKLDINSMLEGYSDLYIIVSVVGRAFSYQIEYRKRASDFFENRGLATTWDTGGTGTHGQDSGYILSFISQQMDLFIDEYLRVNEEACFHSGERGVLLPPEMKQEH